MSSDKDILRVGVMLVHLVSGANIIARVEIDIEQKFYMLWNPMTPVMHSRHLETSEQTEMSISLIPYLPYLDTSEPLLIRDNNVLFIGAVVKAVEALYGQRSGTCSAS